MLDFLPIPGSVLQAKFTGPYVIEKKLSETDYVIRTPDSRRKTCVCQVNMLKPYVVRFSKTALSPPAKIKIKIKIKIRFIVMHTCIHTKFVLRF